MEARGSFHGSRRSFYGKGFHEVIPPASMVASIKSYNSVGDPAGIRDGVGVFKENPGCFGFHGSVFCGGLLTSLHPASFSRASIGRTSAYIRA